MSEATRAAIATAVSTVEGIDCAPYYRQSTKVGDAFVQYLRTDYPNVFGGIRTWRVSLIVHQDVRSAEIYIDEKLPALLEALGTEPVLVVRRVEPIELVFKEGAAVSALAIEGTREE